MADGLQHSFPSVREKIHDYYKQSFMISRLSPNNHERSNTHCPNYIGLQLLKRCQTNNSLPHMNVLPFSAVVPSEKKGTTDTLASRFARASIIDIAATTAAAPFARVKLLLQNQNEMLKAGRLSRPYKGITNCLSRTVKSEGFLSLWRGNTANVAIIFVGPVTRVLGLRSHIYSNSKVDNKNWDWYRFAGFLVGHGTDCVSRRLYFHHLEYAYTRLATDIKYSNYNNQYHSFLGNSYYTMDSAKRGHGDHHQRQFSGLIDVYKKTLKSDGIAGLYRGFNISCFADILFTGLYIGMANFLVSRINLLDTRWLQYLRDKNDAKRAALCIYGSGIIGVTIACYPFETVAVRMMTSTTSASFKYKNSWDAFTQIIKNEGTRSLYKGFLAKLLVVSVTSVLSNHHVKSILFSKQ